MKKAFTLSEVLITLSIVGIIATLTIPSVMKNFHNRLYVAQLQKAISQIESATHTIMNDEHVDNFYETKTSIQSKSVHSGEYKEDDGGSKEEIMITGPEYFLTRYFKVAKKDCGPKSSGSEPVDVSDNCFATGSEGHMQDEDAYHSVGGQNAYGVNKADYCIQTTNGAAICIGTNRSNNTTHFFIDVNGPADPNITGRDAFVLSVNNDGTVHDWDNASKCNTLYSSSYKHLGRYAVGCFQRVVDAGWKIDY